MTSKERLTRLFEGKDIDRIPVWLLFPYFISPSYADIYNLPDYKPILEQVSSCTDTIERMDINTGFCFNANPSVNFAKRNYTEDGYHIEEQTVSYKDIKLRKAVKRGPSGIEIENYIKTEDDIDRILSLPYKPAEPDTELFNKRRDEFGERGLMGISYSDPISVLHGLCTETEFLLHIVDFPEKINQFLDVMYERISHTLKFMLERGVGPLYWIGGPELVTPPLVSPSYFYDLAVKYNAKLFGLIRNYGMKSMLHCHGNIKKVLSGLNQMGFDSIHPVEAPPMGDCHLGEARTVFGKDAIIAGNIQYGDLWSKSEEEMEQLVKSAIYEGRDGRFILATTGGPSAKEINGTVVRNYARLMDAAMRYGKL